VSFLPGFETGCASEANGDDWYTPLWLLAWLPPIALDPCHAAGCAVQAAATLDLRRGDDGLAQAWQPAGNGIVYANPPFSNCGQWLVKCRQEARRLPNVVVALVPAFAGDGPWHAHVWGEAQLVGFVAGRVGFFDGSGKTETKGRGHALILYGLGAPCREVARHIAEAASTHPRAPFWVPARSSAVAVQARLEV
jgi:hypothetical protein